MKRFSRFHWLSPWRISTTLIIDRPPRAPWPAAIKAARSREVKPTSRVLESPVVTEVGFTLDEAFAHCEARVKAHYENFPVGLFVPRDKRRYVHALYAFARVADDFADEPIYEGDREREARRVGGAAPRRLSRRVSRARSSPPSPRPCAA